MINGKPTNENTIYYTLAVIPANQYDGRTPMVYVSNNSKAIENLRDMLIKNESTNHFGPPNVYQVDNVTIPDALRRRMVDQHIAESPLEPPAMASTGMLSYTHDVIVGPDFFHGPSQWMMADTVTSVQTIMQQRNQALQPFSEAAGHTNPYKLFSPDELKDPQIKAGLEMAYAGKGLQHDAIMPAVQRMAVNGWDTAAMVPDFQQRYEHHLKVLHAGHPEWGHHTLQNEALMTTAVEFQQTKCGNDMRQQGVFQGIANYCQEQREQALGLDNQERAQAINYAQRAVDDHLKQNSYGIISRDAQNFRSQVIHAVESRLGVQPFSQAMVQGAIKDVAQEFATRDSRGAIQYGEREGKASFSAIAHDAGEMEANFQEHGEFDGMDEVSLDD